VFGAFEGIYNFLIRMVGLRTDSADAAGSLHAKVKDVKDYLPGIYNRVYPFASKATSVYTGSGQAAATEVTLISITGAGFVGYVWNYCGDSANPPTQKLRIYINGTLAWESNWYAENSRQEIPIWARFTTSFGVAVIGNGGTADVNYAKALVVLD
jgi:hypothetical protein